MAEQVHARKQEVKEDVGIVRILSTDIEGKTKLYPGLTKIKGVSWSISNIVCRNLKLDKKKRIADLTPQEISKISEEIKSPKAPAFLLNRRKDFSTGEDRHLVVTDLELSKEFDIKRLRKIKSYKGIRHANKQPLRGQRTKSHFRTKKRAAGGVKKKK